MASRSAPVQTSFIGGEFSRRIFGRVDVERFQRGVETLENFIIKPGGGVFRTPGTKHLGEVKNSAKSTILLPFIYSEDDALILEVGDQYVRFWNKDGTQVTSGGSAVEVTSPWLEAELFGIDYVQSGNVMYLVHENHDPRTITRNSSTSFSISTIDWTYAPTIRETPGSNGVTLKGFSTWTEGSTGQLEYNLIPATIDLDTTIGKHYRLYDPSDPTKTAWVEVTSKASSGVLNVTAKSDIPSGLQSNQTDIFDEPAFNDGFGYPNSVAFFEERLIFGGVSEDPGRFWGSRVGDFVDFNPADSADDDGVNFAVGGGQSQSIQWIAPGPELLIGTSSAVWKATGGLEQSITPTRIFVREQSTKGCAGARPVRTGYYTLFVQRARHRVRALEFQDAQVAYRDTDLTAVSDHVFRHSRIFSMDYQEERDSIVWMSDDSGNLAGITFDPENDVVGWHRHPDDNGAYESLAVIPQQSFNEVWFVVNRTINGATKRYIERMVEGEIQASNQNDYFYVRCGITATGSAMTTVSGLSHLEGEDVVVLGDGSPQGPFTVASGQITLDTAVDKAQVGLSYTSKLKTLPLPSGISRIKGWGSIMLRIYETMAFAFNGNQIGLRKPTDVVGKPIDPVDRDVDIEASGFSSRAQNEITTNDPLPCNVLMLSGTLYTGDE